MVITLKAAAFNGSMWKQSESDEEQHKNPATKRGGVSLFTITSHLAAGDRQVQVARAAFPWIHTHGYLISTVNITATTCAPSSPSERRQYHGALHPICGKPGARPYMIPVRGLLHDMIGQLPFSHLPLALTRSAQWMVLPGMRPA